ncbi:MAG: amidohydrolase family protein, partial [Chloroflexi bacterium]|nr:amidohydrolase family protein [Chloroflexota bacterium]
ADAPRYPETCVCWFRNECYNTVMIIDFHTHIFPPEIIQNRAEYLTDRCFASLYSSPKAKMASAEDLINSMDRDSIDISVVLNIGWCDHGLCVKTNDYIMDAVSRYPQRLAGFCAVQPLAGDKAVIEIERCAKAGIRGIGELRSDVQGYDIGNKALMQPVVDAAIKNNLLILTHSSEPAGHSYNGKGDITPGVLYRFIKNFPEVKLICSHWGGGLPFYFLMPEVARAATNVYFDTAASDFLYRNDIFETVSRITGADRILFGSDYPLVSQNRLAETILALEIPEETKIAILTGNAQSLLEMK